MKKCKIIRKPGNSNFEIVESSSNVDFSEYFVTGEVEIDEEAFEALMEVAANHNLSQSFLKSASTMVENGNGQLVESVCNLRKVIQKFLHEANPEKSKRTNH